MNGPYFGPCTTIRQYRDRDQDRQNRNDEELEAARREADSFSFGRRQKLFNPRGEVAMNEINKSKWNDGPWSTEPDKEHFKTADGFDAVIIRQSSGGHLCGYVGVPADHPWHGKGYSEEVAPTKEQLEAPVDMDKISILSLFASALGENNATEGMRLDCLISVHGGLTYADKGIESFGEDPALWYFGFDCAHSGDLSPGYDHMYSSDGTYRDIEYVKQEIGALSRQLAAAAH